MKSTEETRIHAREIYDRIIADPNCHNQDNWGEVTECGTTACIAGHSTLIKNQADYSYFKSVGKSILQLKFPAPVSRTAQNNLGLSDEEANDLFFYSDNALALAKLEYVIKGESWL